MSNNKHFDVLVIGVGGMGSATVYELAKRGKKVLGLEQYDIPNTMGSSHGLTRIIRLAYMEDPAYVPLLYRAYELWRDIQLKSGRTLLHITGGIDASFEEGAVFQGSLLACQTYHLPYRVYNHKTLKKDFPAFNLSSGMLAVYQPDGGFLLSEDCISAYVEQALFLGAEIHGREKVIGWSANESGVLVNTDRACYSADKLVVTAGPWSNKLLIPLQGDKAVPERQVVIWTQPKQPEFFAMGKLPIWVLGDEQDMYYGFPVHGIPGFKYGKLHHLRQKVDPDKMDRECSLKDEKILRQFAERFFPESTGPTLSMRSCLFTNTKDNHFIVDRHPDHEHVIFAAGFSGHGFKFVSVIGEVLAQKACDETVLLDIDLFRLNRPTI
ncbi:N-methyl-L-tryptophan oxidase [uncultured Shewanella sp.]|uniref:N-methyl-L-tryptophan oxidase n=1 Tax=uncultured Shewanella sp. TaxID=173975 RepID=UPI0026076A5F|nr:N-methyl-L-tryptophan oxidase [uncultured Shewanella sp.]